MTSDAQPARSARKYLVVDDHAAFRQTVRDFLPANAGEVIECADGTDALEAFAAHRPDWTLMDIAMPGLDGLAATRAIRARFPGAQIIILTQHDSGELREAAGAAGALACVLKDHLSNLPVLMSSLLPKASSAPNRASVP